MTVDTTIGDGQFVVLSPSKDGLTIELQRVYGMAGAVLFAWAGEE